MFQALSALKPTSIEFALIHQHEKYPPWSGLDNPMQTHIFVLVTNMNKEAS